MRKRLIFLLPVLFFALTGFTQPTEQTQPAQPKQQALQGRHIPKTLMAENSASMLLKEDGFIKDSDEDPKCPQDSGVSGLDLGTELGSHEPKDMPQYVKKYHEGLAAKKSHVEIWQTIAPKVTARIKYCYYADPENDYILIYLEESKTTK